MKNCFKNIARKYRIKYEQRWLIWYHVTEPDLVTLESIFALSHAGKFTLIVLHPNYFVLRHFILLLLMFDSMRTWTWWIKFFIPFIFDGFSLKSHFFIRFVTPKINEIELNILNSSRDRGRNKERALGECKRRKWSHITQVPSSAIYSL